MRRRVMWIVAAVAALVVAAAVVALGVIGIPASAGGGAQTSICGVRVGVLDVGESTTITWGDDRATLVVGDRVRVAPWCVLELTGIDGTREGADGGGRIRMIWRLW